MKSRTYFKRRRQLTSKAKGMAARKQIIQKLRAAVAPVSRARRLNRRTGGFIGIETKFLDCAWNDVAINPGAASTGADGECQPSSGCTNCISMPAQGVGEQQRDGKAFTIKSIFVSGTIGTLPKPDQVDVHDIGGYYVALVLDTQTNGAVINSEDVFINPSTVAGAPLLPYPLRNLSNSHRFRVLASKFIKNEGMYAGTDGVSTMSLATQNAPSFQLSWAGNIPVRATTTGTTANVTACADNSIHLIAYASTSFMTPVLAGKSRMRFVG